MKKLFSILCTLLLGVMIMFSQETVTVTANSEDIAYSLDLKVVAKLFAEASTTEQFEIMLNNPDSAFSNLDLNGDGDIDYLRVVEAGTADNKLIVIQAVLAKDIFQDVASIYVEKDNKTQEVNVQIIGDEYIYGKNYIIEPVYVYRPIIYDWLWSYRWYCWESPWYWGYYPHWWYHRHCYAYDWYWHRCYRFHHHHRHYCSFHNGHHHHHGYHNIHSGVTRRDYADRHPENSFSQRHTNVVNASQLRSGVSVRGSNTRQQQQIDRTYNSRNTSVIRTQPNSTVSRSGVSTRSSQTVSTQRSGQQTHQRTSQSQTSTRSSQTVSTQRSGRSSSTTTIQRTPTTSTRSSQPTRTQQVNTQRSSGSTYIRPSQSSSSSSTRSSSSYGSPSRSSGSSSRSSGSYSSPSRSSGSYSSGSSSRSSGSSSSGSRRR